MVHPEIVLKGNRGIGLGGCFNLHIFFGFNGLVKPIAVPSSFHDPARLLVNNLDGTVHDHIFNILVKEGIGFQQLLYGMDPVCLGRIILQQGLFHGQSLICSSSGLFNFRNGKAEVGEHKEIGIITTFGDEMQSFIRQFYLVVFFVNVEVQLLVYLRHVFLLFCQVIVF